MQQREPHDPRSNFDSFNAEAKPLSPKKTKSYQEIISKRLSMVVMSKKLS